MIESVLKARKDYWSSLDKLRQYYISVNEIEKAKWVEDELRSYHRMMKYSYRLDVKDVPPPTLQPKQNITEANNLFRRAIEYKGKGGEGDAFVDNQQRAEILLQAILEKHPESDKIAEAAYHLGDIYENYRPRPQFERAAAYLRAFVPVEQGLRDRCPPADGAHLRSRPENARQSEGSLSGRDEPRHEPDPRGRSREAAHGIERRRSTTEIEVVALLRNAIW